MEEITGQHTINHTFVNADKINTTETLRLTIL